MDYHFIDSRTGEIADIQQVQDQFIGSLHNVTIGIIEFPLLTMIGDYCTLNDNIFNYAHFLHIPTLIDLSDSHVYLDFLAGKYIYQSYR